RLVSLPNHPHPRRPPLMNIARSLKLVAWSLGLLLAGPLLLWTAPTAAQQLVNPAEPETVYRLDTVIDDLAQATVVYLGETHDSQADHAAQLQIIEALYRRSHRLAIGMEMFQRPFQAALDQYLAGTISEAELRQRTEYDQRWGYAWANYAPILRFAKEHQIPLLALNTPTEVTQKVAQKGLSALTPNERRWIPPDADIDLSSQSYRQFLRPIYDEFHDGHGTASGFENFFLSQVLWDETMAEAIARFLTTHPQHQVVVLAGQGHIVYGYGIPSRVARRQARRRFSQRLVLLNPSPLLHTDDTTGLADYLWQSEADREPSVTP
ncbi:MAG TPA: ChaN family lipoprotein, partial [Chroococcidiopsis sp.]